MFREDLNHGGNLSGSTPITIRRTAAIGDVIATTVVADKLLEAGHRVRYQSHGSIHSVLRRHPGVEMISKCEGFAHVNLDGAYEKHPDKRRRHMYGLFMDAARVQLAQLSISLGQGINCRPQLRKDFRAMETLRTSTLSGLKRPFILVCPRSETYKTRQVPDGVWREVAANLPGTCLWCGLTPAPPGFFDLKARHLPMLMDFICLADLVVTVDTGPMHMAAAFGIPILAIGQSSSPELHLSDQVDFRTIEPSGLDCLNCMENLCPKEKYRPPCQNVDPELIISETKRSLMATLEEGISCVIPVFKPRAEMLNRCLEAVLPQVSEVVVTKEMAGVIPDGVMKHPKIRYVSKPLSGIGFGRNVNFGFRHTTGKYVLVLNDDVYLDPGAVAAMAQCLSPKVGLVGMFTRYPDGRIYHAGKVRDPNGGIGFPHIDLHKYHGRIKEPVEMENTNGASILCSRKAFYDIGGFDEGYMFYAEDDDLCMRMRLNGWSVWYQPHATGIHDGHQESSANPAIRSFMSRSNQRFGQTWGAYFGHNRNRTGLGNFDYLKK